MTDTSLKKLNRIELLEILVAQSKRMKMGVLLLVMALILAGYNVWDSERAARASLSAANVLIEQITSNEPVSPPAPDPITHEMPKLPDTMPTVNIDGFDYIGILDVPSENISLPVMADWDMERLKTAPCAYSGSYFTNDLVIAGHNYGKHFSPLKWVHLGADVYFVTVDNVTYHYTVDSVSALSPESVDEMVERTDWDLTLFTCTTGGRKRCTIRCVLADE